MADVLLVQGGVPLQGRVRVGGSKNAVLPLLAATLLTPDPCVIEGVPPLKDVETMVALLEALGARVSPSGERVEVHAEGPLVREAPQALAERMRASFLVLGPLLARTGRALVPLPGGCAIGSRPIDLHLKGLRALGAEIRPRAGAIELTASRLVGNYVYLDFPSVGATENLLMVASVAEGETVIENAASEPEVVDLANLLLRMGAVIRGAGTSTIRIEGVARLRGVTHTAIPDRIEAGTYLLAVAATGGEVAVEGVVPEHLHPLLAKLREAGLDLEVGESRLVLRAASRAIGVDIKTMPHPGFPTDLQAPISALLTTARGTSLVTETVFENRFMHVPELRRMGAQIKVEGRGALIHGVRHLTGTVVRITDLRAGGALVVAALGARGESVIRGLSHVDRGYGCMVEKLIGLGARVRRV